MWNLGRGGNNILIKSRQLIGSTAKSLSMAIDFLIKTFPSRKKENNKKNAGLRHVFYGWEILFFILGRKLN